jgi:hypothetical protein
MGRKFTTNRFILTSKKLPKPRPGSVSKEREMAGMLDAKPLRDAAQKPLAAHHADFVANLEWPRLRKIWSRPKIPRSR